jgi:hypothetical protein
MVYRDGNHLTLAPLGHASRLGISLPVCPWSSTFNDATYTGWTPGNGTWSADTLALTHDVAPSGPRRTITHPQGEGDFEMWFSYVVHDTSDAYFCAYLGGRRLGRAYLRTL